MSTSSLSLLPISANQKRNEPEGSMKQAKASTNQATSSTIRHSLFIQSTSPTSSQHHHCTIILMNHCNSNWVRHALPSSHCAAPAYALLLHLLPLVRYQSLTSDMSTVFLRRYCVRREPPIDDLFVQRNQHMVFVKLEDQSTLLRKSKLEHIIVIISVLHQRKRKPAHSRTSEQYNK